MSRIRIALLVLAFLTFVLHVYKLGQQSLWYDEGFSVYLSRMSLGEITARTASDIHPPLYYYTLHFWMLLAGESEFSVRFLSLIFGLVSVPLAYLAGKRLLDPTSGLLAALLVSISPLFLWYSQEARMYTLAASLSLLSSCLLLRAIEERKEVLWLGYALASIVAIYSHFYSFFILAFQFVFLLVWWALKGKERTVLLLGLVSQMAAVLAYLPWSRSVLLRYTADVSYWRGELVLSEVVRKTLMAFSTGHTILEAAAQPISLVYAAILLLAIVALAVHGGKSRWTLLFLLLYLSIPILLLFLVSYQRPKFHPRYLILASPAFFLLLAGGLSTFLQARNRWRPVGLLLGLASLFFILSTSLYSDYNSYFNIWFTKDDFRNAARHIESHMKDDEVVILTSGHFFPVFTYYYREDNWYPIPDEPTLSTEHVLGYSVADDLNRILVGKRGVWLLLWQDEVVDPNGFLLMMLDQEGERVPVEGGFWGLKLYHYALPPSIHFSSQPKMEHRLSVNFGNSLELLGYSQGEGAEAVLYWRALRNMSEDFKIALRLRDGEGHYWGRVDARPATYGYPTFRWKEGEVLFGRHTIPVLSGTSPGAYELELGIYSEDDPVGLDVLDANGTPLGKSLMLGSFDVPLVVASLDDVQPEIQHPLQDPSGQAFAVVPGELELVGYNCDSKSLQPGDTVDFTLFWHAVGVMKDDYRFSLQLLDAEGKGLSSDEVEVLGTGVYPTSLWQVGQAVRGQYSYTIPAWPAQPAPGAAQLRLVPLDEENGPVGNPIFLFTLPIEETSRVFEPPTPQVLLPVPGNLGDLARLYGYDVSITRVGPGETITLTLYWQDLTTIDVSYTVFTHLLDKDSQVKAQKDNSPVGGARPTTGWVPHEFITDVYELKVDESASPGEYRLEVGMYDPTNGERLPLQDETGIVDTRILLPTVITVTP